MTKKDALKIFKSAPLLELGRMADDVRKSLHPGGIVTFIIDRNINYTNICVNQCRFCAFFRDRDDPDAYVISRRELYKKIKETIEFGGTQILLQGGLNPELDIKYYMNLLMAIKKRFNINIHGFSPPEITYIAEKSNLTIRETLRLLRSSGLDSIPGGGAEVLSDRIRSIISPRKIKSGQWLKVMEDAHRLGMRTTATMMFGSVEKPEDIIMHLNSIRRLQDETRGFTAFIPWPFQPGNTEYAKKIPPATGVEYLRVLSISRIYLNNIPNIQASWVTQGIKLAEIALRFGANDLGSTMIEENVVSATGVRHIASKEDIIKAIKNAGFKPAQRDTYYNILKEF
ncbi:MAG: dehypoxanthine futalosine cyclase [Nitrospirae bacterium]|nr:dehypoxanthine futalosine cyclase [Nitrospirota bacterium]